MSAEAAGTGTAAPSVVVVRPVKRLTGALAVPGDKSMSHRALLLGALAHGTTRIAGASFGEDVRSSAACLRALGAAIEEEDGLLVVEGRGREGFRAPAGPLDCGNSGTTMRLLMGVLAGCPFEATLVGDPSLSRRPMERVAGPLRRMGAIVETTDGPHGKGRPPVRVRGGALRAIDFASETASAQVKSAVLLAGAAAAGVTIVRESARSRDHTERMLRLFGVDVIEDGLSVSLSGPCELEGAGVSVPGDISSAAFFLAAAAGLPGSRVVLRDVGVNPTRTGVLDVLERMGAPTTRLAEEELGFEPVADLALHGPEKLTATRIAGDEVPRLIDELVVLAVLATQAHGTTEIRDARELRVKETDRIEETAALIRALGGAAETHPDGLTIRGPQRLAGGRVDAKGDHRLAMAAAVGGLFATGPTEIHGAQAAAVSYPRFFEDLTSLAPLEV